MSIITQMLERIFGRRKARVLLMGFDSPGRTTALYYMKLGEVVTTCPTIGFNVESLDVSDVSYTIWDVGGRDKIRPLWRHYYPGTDAIIFSVRSDRKWFMEYRDSYRQELCMLLQEDELRDCVLMVWANFQDAPDAMSLEEIADCLELHEIRNRTWNIFGTVAVTGQGLSESMAWLTDELRQRGLAVEGGLAQRVADTGRAAAAATAAGGGAVASAVATAATAAATVAVAAATKGMLGSAGAPALEDRSSKQVPTKARPPQQPAAAEMQASNMEALLLRWLEDEYSEDDVLSSFADGTLKELGHKERLLVSWLLLQKYGRKEAIRQLFHGAKRLLGPTFHETTLYFWLHMVHYATECTKNPLGDFRGFLLLNPQLVNSNLLLDFYTQETIWHDPKAKEEVVMPDKKSLPSLITPVESKVAAGLGKAQPKPPATLKQLTDLEFLDLLEQRRLPAWGHEAKIRAIFLLLKQEGRRQGGTKRIFSKLEQAEGGMHNVTDAYFWIQMVTYYAALAGEAAAPGKDDFATFAGSPQCKPLLDAELVAAHYSDAVLARGVAEFQLPDKKPMPSLAR